MKKISSFILAAVLVVTTLFAMPLTGFAEDHVTAGQTFYPVFDENYAFNFETNDFDEVDNSNSRFYFKPTESDYFTISYDKEHFDLNITPQSGSILDLKVINNQYYYFEKDIDYLLSFNYIVTEADEARMTQFEEDVNAAITAGSTEPMAIRFYQECAAKVETTPESHSDEYDFQVNANDVYITGYKKVATSDDVINVPSTILGLPVTQISGLEAFATAYLAKEIVIPASVRKIGFAAFGANKNATITIANPNCLIETTLSYPALGMEFENGKPSQYKFDDLADMLIETYYPDASNIQKIGIKAALKALYETDDDGYVIFWTFNPAAVLQSAHESTAHAYATTYESKFIGTDAHTTVTNTVPSTCTVKGTKTVTCSDCDYIKETTLKLAAHTPVTDKAVAPTFARAGKTEGSHCKVCGYVITAQETIPKLVPTATSIKSVKALKKGFTVTWAKKTKNNTGYELQYSTKSNFSSKTTKKFKSTKTTSFTKKKLKAKKTYYIRVRAYKVSNGKTYYSKWSAKKKVTTKK